MNNKIILGLVALIVLSIGGYILYSSGPVVSAVGISNVQVQPDEVSVHVTVQTKNKTAVLAQNENKVISDALIDGLVSIGFSKDELKYSNLDVYEDYDYSEGKRESLGFVVSQQLIIKTDSVDRVPAIVDAVIQSGALVSYINFELSEAKQKEYKQVALEQASKDAKDKVSSIASGQGKSVGRLVSIQNQDFGYGPIPIYARAYDAGLSEIAEVKSVAANLNPQDIEVSASVVAQYKLSVF